jgi:TorA maturation chaperone TorD
MNTLAPAGVFSGSDGAQTSLQRADLMYCLAQAFLPPPAGWSVCDWGQPLVDDLLDIGVQLGVDTGPARQAIAMECERWAALAREARGEADDWLVEYARLFLVPPVPVALNAGIYLEGALGGTSTQMMRSCYEAAGVEPDERFRDLPDHVAMQLEFVARLLERAARGESEAADMAGEYCAEFVHAWAGPMQQACQQAAVRFPAARVYAALVQLLRTLVRDPALG